MSTELDDVAYIKCPECKGVGEIETCGSPHFGPWFSKCSDCGGTGKKIQSGPVRKPS